MDLARRKILDTSRVVSRVIPLDADKINQRLDDLEKFIYAKDDYPSLVKAALLHAQFETIHPFADGNGRTGRMLVAMYIHHLNLLELPVLYLSSYFKKHQKLYYQRTGRLTETTNINVGTLAIGINITGVNPQDNDRAAGVIDVEPVIPKGK